MTDSEYLRIVVNDSRTLRADRLRAIADRIEALEAGLELAEKARIELAALVANPSDPDFTAACPNIADSTCVHKAYIDLQYAKNALVERK